MDKLDALEIVWKMLPSDATDVQKEAWQTVKRIVHAPQADNTGSPKLPTREQFISWLATFESAPSAMSVYEWLCRQLRAGA